MLTLVPPTSPLPAASVPAHHEPVLVAYASAHGTTREIAERIAAGLRSRGVHAALVDVAAHPAALVAPHSRVVVAAPVRGERHHPAVVAWLQLRARELAGRDLSLVSVSLSAASGGAWDGRTARYVDALACETGARPDRVVRVGGALRYRSAAMTTRVRMRHVASARGLATDASCDHAYTDWTVVDALADDLARRVHAPARRALRAAS